MGLQVTDNSHEHLTERVINVKSTSIMWDVLVVKDGTVLAKPPNVIVHEDKEKSLLIDRVLPDDSNLSTQKKKNLGITKTCGDRGQQGVESGDKNCASYNWSIGNN